MKQLSEKHIIELCLNANSKEEGFKILMNTYKERLYWSIRRIVQLHEDADDVLQNTFIKVYRYVDNFKEESSLYTWMYRIATNESLTFLKKKQKQQTGSLDKMVEEFGNQLVADPFFCGNDWQLQLKKAMETLPPKQKTVFVLRYYDEMPYEQMSKVLETSEGALKASYHHAAKKIETYIKENE